MNEEDNKTNNLHTWIDPEMEARIVALILGEASDFEREELERIIAENPEMLAFRRRIEEIHGALGELAEITGDKEDDWKLPVANREILEAAFSGEKVSDEGDLDEASAAETVVIRQSWRWGTAAKIAAIIVVLMGVGAIVTTTFQSKNESMSLADSKSASPAYYRDFVTRSEESDYAIPTAEPAMDNWARNERDGDEVARSSRFLTSDFSRENRRLGTEMSSPQPKSSPAPGWKRVADSTALWDHEAFDQDFRSGSGVEKSKEAGGEELRLAEINGVTGGRKLALPSGLDGGLDETTWASQPGVIRNDETKAGSESIRASGAPSTFGYGGEELTPADSVGDDGITVASGPAVKKPGKVVTERLDRLEEMQKAAERSLSDRLQPLEEKVVVEKLMKHVENLQKELPQMEKQEEMAKKIEISGKSKTADRVIQREISAEFETGVPQIGPQVDSFAAKAVDGGIAIDSKRERNASEGKEDKNWEEKGPVKLGPQFADEAEALRGWNYRNGEGSKTKQEVISGEKSGERRGLERDPAASIDALGIALSGGADVSGLDSMQRLPGGDTADEETVSKFTELFGGGGETYKKNSGGDPKNDTEKYQRPDTRDRHADLREGEKAARSRRDGPVSGVGSGVEVERKEIVEKEAMIKGRTATAVDTYFDSLSTLSGSGTADDNSDGRRKLFEDEEDLRTRVIENSSGTTNFGAGFSSVDDVAGFVDSKPGEAPSFPVTPATPTSFETRGPGSSFDDNTVTHDFDGGIGYGGKHGGSDLSNTRVALEAQIHSKDLKRGYFWYDESRKIDLNLDPDVVEFEGFISYETEPEVVDGKDRIPRLGDLPLVGRLFRSDSVESKQKLKNLYNSEEGRESNRKLGLLTSEKGRDAKWFGSSGEDTTVDITREFTYPTEYDPPEIPNVTTLASGLVPIRPAVVATTPPAGLNEKSAKAEPFSTFSLNVSDVSFKLAKAALENNQWPEADKIRIEEFVNAFDYGDPLPASNDKVACRVEQAIHPFLQQRNLVRVAMRTGAAGRAADTPLKLTFLLDNSGSMERADRQETVRRAFAELAKQLKPNDQVTLISFARQPRLLADKVGGEQARDLVAAVKNMPSEGGTNLEAALNLAFEKAQEQHADGAQNRIVLLTDGAANLGDADPETLSKKIEQFREAGIAFDAAGIVADGLNDEILEALTRKGDGRYYLLDSPADAGDGFAEKVAGALRPSAKNVKVQVEFNPERVGNYKLLGFEKHRLKKEDFRNDAVDAAEMAAEETGVAVYQIEPLPGGSGDIGSVSVRFRDLSTDQMIENRWPISYSASAPRPDQSAASMRVATAAAMFAAKLKGGPLGEAVDLEVVAKLITGLPERFSESERIAELQSMVAKARELEGSGR